MPLTQYLVIVESPSKCKKIEEILGSNYKCLACFGHLRELCHLDQIDIQNGFKPSYSLIQNSLKLKQMDVLKKAIQNCNEVILATDNDREGEAIAWHLCELFHLNPTCVKRILFGEITQSAIEYAVSHPTTINMNLVLSQQARQILDLLVGFKVTPFLWKHLPYYTNGKHALSAGRCQTPSLKLVYEHSMKESDSENFLIKVKGYFTPLNIPFSLNKTFEHSEEVVSFLEQTKSFNHIFSKKEPILILKQPPTPLTTSLLLQLSPFSSSKETMQKAQTLYEKGYITYMRTDGSLYSRTFLNQVKNYTLSCPDLKDLFQNDFLESCSGTHEPIRPCDISLKNIDSEDSKEKKLYKMIWNHCLESCLLPAQFNQLEASILAPDNAEYIYTAEYPLFLGWLSFNQKKNDNTKYYEYLLTWNTSNTSIPYKKIIAQPVLKKQKYLSEAQLIRKLEKKGIGRPSTYASLIEKIQDRHYVQKSKKDFIVENKIVKEWELIQEGIVEEKDYTIVLTEDKNKFKIEPLGKQVCEYLYQYFGSVFDYTYTKRIENELDKVAKGELNWVNVCQNCLEEIERLIKELKKGELKEELKEELKKEELKKENKVNLCSLGKYQGEDLFLKQGKYGLYAEWGKQTSALKAFGNRPLENIHLEDVVQILEQSKNNILREINDHLSIRKSAKGDYIYYKTKTLKKPLFFCLNHDFPSDYLTCDLKQLKEAVKAKYHVW